jgi:metal-responsive CopG/Arc/MetJ family transcriptional regulator
MMASKRLSISLPEQLVKALEEAIKADPTLHSKSGVVGEALESYLALKYPELLEREEAIKGPKVLRYIKRTKKRAPSPTLRVGRLGLPRWRAVEG